MTLREVNSQVYFLENIELRHQTQTRKLENEYLKKIVEVIRALLCRGKSLSDRDFKGMLPRKSSGGVLRIALTINEVIQNLSLYPQTTSDSIVLPATSSTTFGLLGFLLLVNFGGQVANPTGTA